MAVAIEAKLDGLRAAYGEACALLACPPEPVHLLGIAGVGVAALAVQLAARGHAVSGCDSQPGRVGAWLERQGIRVARGHDPAHVDDTVRWLVRSPAVADDEPEILAARARGLPVLPRGVVLPALLRDRASIAVCGTHGKTTTTAMLAHILAAAGRPHGFCIGGEADALGGVARSAGDGVLVVEADESDGTLAVYEPEAGLVTNVEPDHVDFFEDEADLDLCFRQFAERVRRVLVYCADDAGACRAARYAVRCVSYGVRAEADWRLVDCDLAARSASCALRGQGGAEVSLVLPVPGLTNLLDAAGAVAMAVEWGITPARAAAALADFRAVRRRFEVVAEARGITVINDYAHHPTEIEALMQQVRGLRPARVLAVFQPHRYTRTAALGAAFPPSLAGVDLLWLAPVYAASEDPVPGGTSADLLRQFEAAGVPARGADSLLAAWEAIRENWRAGDVVLVIGAGDVERIAQWAADELAGKAEA